MIPTNGNHAGVGNISLAIEYKIGDSCPHINHQGACPPEIRPRHHGGGCDGGKNKIIHFEAVIGNNVEPALYRLVVPVN